MTKRAIAPETVRREWLRRVEAEYRSAAITQHLTLWLIQIGASPDLVAAGLRIVRDEMTHASMSYRVFGAAGGEGAPTIDRASLALTRNDGPLEDDVTRTCIETFCLGETVAVPLFSELRRECSIPAARRALDRVLRDEVRHRDFGWTLLGWIFEQPWRERAKQIATRELPGMFRRLRASYAPTDATDRATRDERAWGLMAPARYGAILARTVDRDYAPRFAKLGVDARAAWDASAP